MLVVLAVVVALGLLAGVLAVRSAVDGAARVVVRRPPTDDGAARLVVAVAGAVVLSVLLAGLLGAFGGGDSPSAERRAKAGAARVVTGGVPLRPVTIGLVASPEHQLPRVPVAVGGLADGTVVVVGVSGLDPGSRGSVHQCPSGALVARACRAGLPLSADGNGKAVVLVDLEDRFEVAGARPVDCTNATGCSIVLFGSSRLEAVTVFGQTAPRPVTIEAEPARVPPGGTTLATARGLPPGGRTSFVVCRPAGRGEADCGAPISAGMADGAGEATAQVTVGAGRCPRGARCALAVVVGDGAPRAFAPLRLIGRSGASYEQWRLRAGLVVAGLLLLVALWLLRRTDWTPVDGDPFAGVTLPEDPFADVDAGAIAR